MADRCTHEEWDVLFRAHPPRHGNRPTRAECEALCRQLGRTPDAIDWMWDDAERYLRGAKATTTSQRLKDYLADRRR